MDYWAIFLAVAMIFIVVLIMLWIAELFATPSLSLGPACISDSDCPGGNLCQNGRCRSAIGGSCSTLEDCVMGAIACYNSMCLIEPRNGAGQPCPCQQGLTCQNGFCRAPMGGTCLEDSDCLSGLMCYMGTCSVGPTGVTGQTGATACGCHEQEDIVIIDIPKRRKHGKHTQYDHDVDIYEPQQDFKDDNTYQSYNNNVSQQCLTSYDCYEGNYCAPRMAYRGYSNGQLLPLISNSHLPGENVIDLTIHQDRIYLLLEGGDILRLNDHVPIQIESQITITRIFSFTGRLYALSNGYLYTLREDYSLEETSWEWDLVKGINSVTHISETINGDYLWIETSRSGYLYDRNWNVVDKVKNKSFNKRIYGLSKETWADYYSDCIITSDDRRYKLQQTFAFYPDGQPFIAEQQNIYHQKFLIYQGKYVPFFIFERGCRPLT